uniref:G_PROTEIN_RECEP_F1_2 domain-containing protein n=1 Tax=Heterorhabditis bacteriophora TaxID=37862 RepID=A0A1I7WMU1_HETBA
MFYHRELMMENGTRRNCSYRYSSDDSTTSIALWIDGPCTCIAAILALIGARFAVRFLYRAGLNKELTAALFSLCAIDSLLMLTVFLFYCIEAIGVLLFRNNFMYNYQGFTSSLHGVASSLTTASFTRYKAILMTLTQTIGPVGTILVLTVLTEYRVHRSLKARRKLFESQQRSRAVVLSEELKERVSRTVAIFIAIKFLIFRSMPVFFDVYENLYGIESFGVALSILVRVSDFMIVLNSATNSLAYFGKKRWLEKRLRLRLLKKEEKRQQKASLNTSRRISQNSDRLSVSLTTSFHPCARVPFRNPGLGPSTEADRSPLVRKDGTNQEE